MNGCAILTNNSEYKEWLLKYMNFKETKGRNRLFSEESPSLSVILNNDFGRAFIVKLFNNTLNISPDTNYLIDLEMKTTDSDTLEDISKVRFFKEIIEKDRNDSLITLGSGFNWDDPYITTINIKSKSRLSREFNNIISIAKEKNNGSDNLPEYIDTMIIFY